MAYKAIIAGASGLIGSNLLNILLEKPEYDEVLIIARKELPVQHKKLAQLIVDFDQLALHTDAIKGHVLFCCLGTTRGQTPDLKQYKKIDHDFPLQLAQLAATNGVNQYHFISSVGANPESSSFYLKIKGQAEDALQRVGLITLHIYQPSILSGKRTNSRFVESFLGGLMRFINPLLTGGLKKYRSIKALTVAHAMYKYSLETATGIFIHTSDKIQNI